VTLHDEVTSYVWNLCYFHISQLKYSMCSRDIWLHKNQKQEVSSGWDGRARAIWAEKWELLCPFLSGKLRSNLTKCRLGQVLPPYQVVSWSIPAMGRKWGAVMPAPFSKGKLGLHVTECGRLCPTVWPQYIGWQWRNFFTSAVFRHFVGQALRNVCSSDVSRRQFLNKIATVRKFS